MQPPCRAGGTQSPEARRPRNTPMAGLTPEQREEIEKQMKEAEATPPKLVEYRLFFSDYRKVDGVQLPHRIARGTGRKDHRRVGHHQLQGEPGVQGRPIQGGQLSAEHRDSALAHGLDNTDQA